MIEFNVRFLETIRRKAYRSRVWFRVLNKAERAILTLVPKCVDTVKSPRLIDIVAKIIVKIQLASRSPLDRFRDTVARPLALKIARIAKKWGNESAENWAEDKGFIQCLAVNSFNDSSISCAGR